MKDEHSCEFLCYMNVRIKVVDNSVATTYCRETRKQRSLHNYNSHFVKCSILTKAYFDHSYCLIYKVYII